MKNVKMIAAAVVLATAAFGVSAAEYVAPAQTQNLQKMGVVTASAYSLDALQEKLVQKADKAGATAYTITTATGKDQLRGSAVIYK
ncbi:multiple stress resistance protein BhsA [Pectobacterium cacticida]|uniref:multiple stress resistance protein BhsA n=1 Tax=Pectobacterium cacticida TaxID=69221 RepID=UPI0039882A86